MRQQKILCQMYPLLATEQNELIGALGFQDEQELWQQYKSSLKAQK